MMAVSGAGRHERPDLSGLLTRGLADTGSQINRCSSACKIRNQPNEPACNELSGSVCLSGRVIIGTFSNQICGLGV